MKAAALIFLAAAAFCASAIAGVPRLGSSRPAPPAIILGGGNRVAPAGVALRARDGTTAVRQRIEQAKLSAYRAGRAHGVRP